MPKRLLPIIIADGVAQASWGAYTLASAFQPIFSFENGTLKLRSFEGLIRPSRGGEAVSPWSFFKTILPEDRLEVERLTRTLHLKNSALSFGARCNLFINFDPSLFHERNVVRTTLDELRDLLQETKIVPAGLVCEVTEQSAGSDAALNYFVDALKREGYSVAIDDYGEQHSDLERVMRLKPNIVKFDAKWLKTLMRQEQGAALLAMTRRFRSENIATVFEGIEESWQLDLAAEVGASMVQGYALARPELAPTPFKLDFSPAATLPTTRLDRTKDSYERLNVNITTKDAIDAVVVRAQRPPRAFGRRGS